MRDYYVDELLEMNIYVKALQDSLIHASWVKAIILVNKLQLVVSLNKRCWGKRWPGNSSCWISRAFLQTDHYLMQTPAWGSVFQKWPMYKSEFFFLQWSCNFQSSLNLVRFFLSWHWERKKKKAEPEQNTSKKLRNWEMKKYNPIYNIWKGGGLFVCVLCFSWFLTQAHDFNVNVMIFSDLTHCFFHWQYLHCKLSWLSQALGTTGPQSSAFELSHMLGKVGVREGAGVWYREVVGGGIRRQH